MPSAKSNDDVEITLDFRGEDAKAYSPRLDRTIAVLTLLDLLAGSNATVLFDFGRVTVKRVSLSALVERIGASDG